MTESFMALLLLDRAAAVDGMLSDAVETQEPRMSSDEESAAPPALAMTVAQSNDHATEVTRSSSSCIRRVGLANSACSCRGRDCWC